jgi:6-pyruvoyltetrahydropterin/6-carboxytetrahydropterin synthase
MQHAIEIRHNFESGHRLPHLPGKCQNLHGHSFLATVTIAANRLNSGIVVDYGEAKAWLRSWIDANWDHGLILGEADPLVEFMTGMGKVYDFPGWPTVENLAQHLGERTDVWCRERNSLGHVPHLICTNVHVQETAVNAATWTNPTTTDRL